MRSNPSDYEMVAPGSLQAIISLLAQEPGSVASDCRRHRRDGAICGREAAGAKTGQHLEPSRIAAHRSHG